MLTKTKGIVLGFIRYKESSIIARIYTKDLGLRSYIVNGVRSIKTSKIAFFQPLTVLDLVVYEKEKTDIQRIAEMQIAYPFQSIPFKPYKISISFFLTELLGKSLKDETKNEELYDFLENSIKIFDQLTFFANFHLQFLIQLSEFLGFAIHDSHELQSQLIHAGYKLFNPQYHDIINELIAGNYLSTVNMNGHLRSEIADYLLKFYALHLENFGTIQSFEILKGL
jgi:DNA repair protein RecO (recombination protein O)